MDDGDPASAFDDLERNFQDTIAEITADSGKAKVLESFKSEYEKLHTALMRSHESEKRLSKKIRELGSDIGQSAQNMQTALKTAAEDAQQIQTLRRDIEAQQKLVEQSYAKERKAKETISQFKAEIADLQQRIEQGAGMSADQEAQLGQLKASKEQLEKDRDMLKQNTEMLQKICQGRLDEVHRVELSHGDSQAKILDMQQCVAEKRSEVEAAKRQKEELEMQMKDLRLDGERLQEELQTITRTIQSEQEELKRIEEEVAEGEREEEKLNKRVRLKMDEKKMLQEKLEQEEARNSRYVQENQQRELTLRAKREEIGQHTKERDKILKTHDALKGKHGKLENDKRNLENMRNDLKQELKAIQEETDSKRREGDVDRKKIEDLLRERDILNKNVIKADERTKKQIDLVKRQETQAMNMQKDILRWKSEAEEFRNRIKILEQQREKYGIELTQANAKFFAAKEELKIRGGILTDLKKQIANVQAKRNQQKNLYDAVCMDRNLNAKILVESNEQIAEMRRKFKIMHHQTTALKEEIREKDNRLLRGHFDKKKVLKNNELLRDAKEKANRKMKYLQNIVETQRAQLKKLEGTIQAAEQERQAQQKELEGVIGERDILGAQLIRRNEELALLYEKIKIQQSTLQKGEIQYKERVDEVSKLRAEIRKAKADVAATKTKVTNVESLKKEIHHLNKTLLREETKTKALQEELENPMNVHRWRELEGSDPATYEMIQKVKSLQKLLIAKTEEVVEKDALIQEKEKLYVQLKNIISRQPGPEVAEQLAWYSQNLKEKTQHMRQMAGELEMYHTQVQDLRDEIERHNRDFSSVKQAYFQRKRQERRMQQMEGE